MTTDGILPTYQRFVNGMPVSFSRRWLRTREKYILIFTFFTFGFLFFGTLFFMPEFPVSNKAARSVYEVYDQLRRAGPDLLIPPPPHIENGGGDSLKVLRHEREFFDDPHILDDKRKLKNKIDETDIGIEERDVAQEVQVVRANVTLVTVKANITRASVPFPTSYFPIIDNADSLDYTTRSRRDKIKEMMKHAWENYVRYAWGKNELKPISKRGHSGSIFGSMPFAATILDGLDTLYIMGMTEEYNQARDWVINELDVNAVVSDVSVFETNIRLIGGLLTCYSFTGDSVFKNKAKEIADKLLPAFQTPTGIPYALVNFRTGVSKNYGWASGGSSILSELGTLHLEFSYLSDVTGIPTYREKIEHIRQFLQRMEKPNGLYPNYLNPKTGKWGQYHMSVGALGDSFYEYLLKAWIQSNKEDVEARQMFDDSMQAILQHMLFTSPGGLTYFGELKFDIPEHKMDHLACFSGGLLALGSKTLSNEVSDRYMDVAEKITHTCHESYNRSTTKLGPEAFRFSQGNEARALKSSEKYYILRPEVIESYFVLYRLTKDPKYREWGWEAVQALENYCRVPGGFTGIKNVYSKEPQKDDVQQSFFLAETLKYLYLLFSDDSLIPFDEWVFNTEAHPLPIKGVNRFYREATIQQIY